MAVNDGETDFTAQPQYHIRPQHGEAIKHFEDTLLACAVLEIDHMVNEIQSGKLRPWDRLDRMRRILADYDRNHQWFMHYMGHAVAPVGGQVE